MDLSARDRGLALKDGRTSPCFTFKMLALFDEF
jgi:hypothetical protein